MGFGFDKLTNLAHGGSSARSSTFVDPAQQPFLDFLRGEAQTGLPGQQAIAGQLFGQGQEVFGQLAGGQALQPFTEPGFADEQIESLTDILNRNLGFNLQNIGQTASMGNTFGGGRQGVAQGAAIGDTQLALAAGSADIMQSDLGRRQDAARAQMVGQLGALGSIPSLQSVPLQPLSNFAGLIGQPTVLGASNSFNAGQGISGNINQSMSSFGNLLQGVGSVTSFI